MGEGREVGVSAKLGMGGVLVVRDGSVTWLCQCPGPGCDVLLLFQRTIPWGGAG